MAEPLSAEALAVLEHEHRKCEIPKHEGHCVQHDDATHHWEWPCNVATLITTIHARDAEIARLSGLVSDYRDALSAALKGAADANP